MSFQTEEERRAYWQKRAMDHTISTSGQVGLDFKNIFSELQHAGFDQLQFLRVFAKISEAFSDFTKTIEHAKTVEEVKQEEIALKAKAEEAKIEKNTTEEIQKVDNKIEDVGAQTDSL